jgi:hypothetical protein
MYVKPTSRVTYTNKAVHLVFKTDLNLPENVSSVIYKTNIEASYHKFTEKLKEHFHIYNHFIHGLFRLLLIQETRFSNVTLHRFCDEYFVSKQGDQIGLVFAQTRPMVIVYFEQLVENYENITQILATLFRG